MARDISREQAPLWAAETAGGVVCVAIEGAAHGVQGADLVILRDDNGRRIAARMLGPTVSDASAGSSWHVAGRYRVDPGGTPLAELVSAEALAATPEHGHAWGRLGLPHGLRTHVRAIDEQRETDEIALAFGSSGHRIGEAARWLTLAPGDPITVDGSAAMVVAIDRRKRTVEIDVGGETRQISLDDLDTEEMHP